MESSIFYRIILISIIQVLGSCCYRRDPCPDVFLHRSSIFSYFEVCQVSPVVCLCLFKSLQLFMITSTFQASSLGMGIAARSLVNIKESLNLWWLNYCNNRHHYLTKVVTLTTFNLVTFLMLTLWGLLSKIVRNLNTHLFCLQAIHNHSFQSSDQPYRKRLPETPEYTVNEFIWRPKTPIYPS